MRPRDFFFQLCAWASIELWTPTFFFLRNGSAISMDACNILYFISKLLRIPINFLGISSFFGMLPTYVINHSEECLSPHCFSEVSTILLESLKSLSVLNCNTYHLLTDEVGLVAQSSPKFMIYGELRSSTGDVVMHIFGFNIDAKRPHLVDNPLNSHNYGADYTEWISFVIAPQKGGWREEPRRITR